MVRSARPVRKIGKPAPAAPAPKARSPLPRKPVAKAPSAKAKPVTAPKVVAAAPAPAEDGVIGFAGFRRGTGAEVAAIALCEGGLSRTDIMRDLRTGPQGALSKNWSVTISTVTSALKEKGYNEQGFWQMVAPEEGAEPIVQAPKIVKAATPKPVAKPITGGRRRPVKAGAGKVVGKSAATREKLPDPPTPARKARGSRPVRKLVSA